MSLFDHLASRLLAALGLDFDFDVDFRGQPFHAITPTLTLGARPRPEHLEVLRKLGITHVVSCLEQRELPLVAFLDAGFETLFLPVRDGMEEDIASAFPRFFEFVSGAGPRTRVLVHCQAGVSRSATLAIAAVMQTQQLRFYDAYRWVRARRPQVLPNIGFASQLQRFESALFGEPRPAGYASLTRYLHEACNVPVEIELLHDMLELHDYDALTAIRTIFGDEVPRVVQGVRL